MLLDVFVNELPAHVMPTKRHAKLGIAGPSPMQPVHKARWN